MFLHSFCKYAGTIVPKQKRMYLLQKISFTTFLVYCFFAVSAYPAEQKIPENINLAFETGNAKLLASYFNQNVELVVLDNDNVYSKAQAQQIVTNFFSRFQPLENNAFSIIHSSGKGDAKSVISKLKTEKGEFRVYFLLKTNSSKEYIHQLRIEKQ